MSAVAIAIKKCNKCGPQPISEFGSHKKSPDGLDWSCRSCKASDVGRRRGEDENFNERQLACIRTWRASPEGKSKYKKYTSTKKFKKMKKKLHRAYVKRETARIKALNAILIARRKNPSLRPTTCQCGCGVIGRLYADFDDPVHPFDGLRFLASLCKGKATRARRAAQKRTQARCVANKDENHALEYTPNATSESTTTLLEALELPKNEFKTIAAENKRSVAVEFGVPDVRFTASKEEYLSRFMRMRVPAQMRPLRSELQLALAITGDRVAYDPDWEPDCE